MEMLAGPAWKTAGNSSRCSTSSPPGGGARGPQRPAPTWRDQNLRPRPALGEGRGATGPAPRHPALGRPSRRLGLTPACHCAEGQDADSSAQSAEGPPPQERHGRVLQTQQGAQG